MYDYGEFHICGGRMLEKRVQQEFWVKGRLIVIEAVPTGVCLRCGERVVKADIGRSIATLLGGLKRGRKVRTMSVPVIRFARQVA